MSLEMFRVYLLIWPVLENGKRKRPKKKNPNHRTAECLAKKLAHLIIQRPSFQQYSSLLAASQLYGSFSSPGTGHFARIDCKMDGAKHRCFCDEPATLSQEVENGKMIHVSTCQVNLLQPYSAEGQEKNVFQLPT